MYPRLRRQALYSFLSSCPEWSYRRRRGTITKLKNKRETKEEEKRKCGSIKGKTATYKETYCILALGPFFSHDSEENRREIERREERLRWALTLSKWSKDWRYSLIWSSESPLESRIRIWFSVSFFARWTASSSPVQLARSPWTHTHTDTVSTPLYRHLYTDNSFPKEQLLYAIDIRTPC